MYTEMKKIGPEGSVEDMHLLKWGRTTTPNMSVAICLPEALLQDQLYSLTQYVKNASNAQRSKLYD